MERIRLVNGSRLKPELIIEINKETITIPEGLSFKKRRNIPSQGRRIYRGIEFSKTCQRSNNQKISSNDKTLRRRNYRIP